MKPTTDSIDTLKTQLAQLKELHATGVLPDAQFEEGKSALERRILDLVLSGATVAAQAPAAKAESKASKPAATATTEEKPGKPSSLLLAGLVVGVIAIAGGGYLWKGAPGQSAAGTKQGATADGKPAPHATGAEQIAAMTEKLADRLKDKPDDVEGWSMLARSYSVLGRHADALKAYEKASNLRKDDPTLLADYADSLAVNNNSSLAGEPMKLVERALKIDPKNLKALYLAGTHSFNTKDYANAVKIWEKLMEVAPAGQCVCPASGARHCRSAQSGGYAPGCQAAGRRTQIDWRCRCRWWHGQRHRNAVGRFGQAGAARRHRVHFCPYRRRLAHAAGHSAQAG